jgi:branched-chain amino acid transport system permease protein
MGQLVNSLLGGVSYGCAYGLLAIGLVLGYKTSGVFNLAFGAVAYVVALLYGASRDAHWPALLAFVLWVLVFAPAMGVVLERTLFSFVRNKPFALRLIPVVGLLIAIPPIAGYLRGGGRPTPYPVFFSPARVYFRIGGYPINGGFLSTVVFSVVVLVVLSALLKYTLLGLRMRAVVESPRLLQLAGTDSDVVSAFSWAVSAGLAGLAGVLLAPILHSIDSFSMTALVVAATAGAAVGGLESLVLAFLGSLAIGIIQQLLAGYIPPANYLAHGLRPSLPFIVLVLALMLNRRLFERGSSDPLSVVDVPPPPLEHTTRTARGNLTVRSAAVATLTLGVGLGLSYLSGSVVEGLITSLAVSVVFLSYTVSAGIGGQISLCQVSFAGLGAFVAAQLAAHLNFPILLGCFVGAAVSGLAGVLIALPSTRLGGLPLSLATLAFALLADNLLFPASWMGNGVTGLQVPRPEIGSFNMNSPRSMFFLLVVVVIVVAWVVGRIRDGYLGATLRAVAASERGAESIGIDLRYARSLLFGVSGFIAGLGGGFYAMSQQYVSPTDFVYQLSLVYVVVALAFGVKTVDGAIIGALAYVMFSQVLPNTRANSFGPLEYIIFGVASIYFAAHPEGVVEHARRLIGSAVRSLRSRYQAKPVPPTA